MSDTPTLATPRLEVMLADGRVLQVQALNPDLLRYDRTAAKHSWPKPGDAPFLWLTFLAWAALRRSGQLGEDVEWGPFSEELCLQVRNLGESSNGVASGLGADVADPTPSGVVPE